MAAGQVAKKAADKDKLSPETILQLFNQLRQEYTNIITKVHELEMDQSEHSIVIEALKEVDASRKCFRMIGGVLVERTVGDVLPALDNNRSQLGAVIDRLKQQLVAKEKEMTLFKEKHNLRVKGEERDGPASQSTDKASSGVLVPGPSSA
ncbi:prefoldin subunit 2 [Nematostella vectensis]|nr:prefoldin subunit 2 [Nematostella vectensis]